MSVFKGSGVAICTPFNAGGINFEAFGRLVDFQIENGTDAIIVCGTTGEPSTMTTPEKEAAISFCVERVAGRVPVVAGTGGNNTAAVVEASKRAATLGADALLIVTPYYNKATQSGLVAHYSAVADAVDLPIIIYNVPARTGLNMLPETLHRLSSIPTIVGMKEASGDIAQVAEMARLCPNIDLYSGNDDMIVPLMSLGGSGVISVVANIAPRDTHDMVMKYLSGDIDGARRLQLDMKPLIDALFTDVNPIPVKTALNLMGFHMGSLRLPLTPMGEANLARLKREMSAYGLI
ncbi:MAG: 4-hydroxy-tetrahydrodipicolinate synthase [Christensenellales bacterium]|jgi:4-hydroxy-tetrahydrodipicolinate synthase